MKKFKRALSVVLMVVLMFSVNILNTELSTTTQAASAFAITSPSNNGLVAAGYIDIKWNSASGSVKNYNVYVDGSLVNTTTSTQYEFYTTKVNYHTAWIEAVLTNGQKVYTPTVKFGVSKKGLGLATDMGAHLNLKNMGLSWYYNWGEKVSTGQQYQGVEYVPMIWKSTSANDIKNRVTSLKNQGFKYVLTFNEPDLPKQCNMTVDAVYSAWQGLAGITGIQISSPVTAQWPQNSPEWFQAFMNKLDTKKDHDVDFISIHCYPDNYGGAGMAKWFLENVVDWTWNTYHKPIWITEFSTTGQYITATGGNGTKEFWEAVMPELDKRDYVIRYAAFGFNSAREGLWTYSTGALTPGGEVYKSLGNPTTEYKTGNAVNPYYTKVTTPQTTKVVKPKKVTIKSVKNLKKRKVKLTLKKVKNAVGYQVKICDNKKFNGYWTKTIKKTTYTFKKLDKKTRYYFKARAYVMNGKKKLYGSWSKAKSVKVKK